MDGAAGGAGVSLVQAVEATVPGVGRELRLIERADGAIELWPAIEVIAPADGDRSRRSAALARCLSSLRGSGLRVELVCRGETFVRCRA